jgi:cell division protein FtsB
MRYVKQLSLTTFLVVYALVTLATIMGEHGIVHLWNLRAELQSLKARAIVLVQENEALSKQIKQLQQDDKFLEKVVREELKFVKEGEIVYLFRSSSETSE